MFKRILILDTETTGLDPKTHSVIEVAACLYSVADASPIDWASWLICHPTNEAEEINRIPVSLLAQGHQAKDAWDALEALAESADAIVAHRAEFDRGFVSSKLRDMKPWICSKFDIEWPKGNLGDHLVHLALAHGVAVVSAHRAMADVDTLVRTFQAAALIQDTGPMLVRASRPKVLVQALVSYDDREKAKAAGFSWEADRKRWTRRIAKEDVAALGFRTAEVSS